MTVAERQRLKLLVSDARKARLADARLRERLRRRDPAAALAWWPRSWVAGLERQAAGE